MRVYETERLWLHPITVADASFVLKLMNTPKWIKNIGDRNVKSIEQAKEYINQRIAPQMERLGYGNFCLSLKSDGTKIGTCGLHDKEGIDGVDIGFALLPEFEGKSFGFESASKMMELAKEEFDLDQIKAITIESNLRSRNLIEKLGLKYVKHFRMKDDPEELMMFEISFNE